MLIRKKRERLPSLYLGKKVLHKGTILSCKEYLRSTIHPTLSTYKQLNIGIGSLLTGETTDGEKVRYLYSQTKWGGVVYLLKQKDEKETTA